MNTKNHETNWLNKSRNIYVESSSVEINVDDIQARIDYFESKVIQHLSPNDRKLFNKFGNGPITNTSYSCLHHAFEAQAALNPKNIAAVHEGSKITYKELNRQANYLALILMENGVRPGDNVGLYIQRSIPMLVGILATLKVGAAYVPQHVGVAPDSQLKYITEVGSIKVILTRSDFKSKIPVPEGCVCLSIDEVINSETSKSPDMEFKPVQAVSEDDQCFILFTSGTTGKPNGVQVTHKNVCNVVLNEPGNLGIGPCIKVAQILSIAFDMAAWEIFGCLCNGGTLLIRGKDIAETAEKAHVIIATPSVLARVNRKNCKTIMTVAVAGEPCPAPLVERWAPICDFYNSCGPTETTIVNTMQLCKPSSEIPSIGKPIPNNTVYILDAEMNPCPIGEVGVMWAGGSCVTSGYLNNDNLNAKKYLYDPFLNDGGMMFHTGDLGRWNEHGELEHHGRVDDQVKISGFRVELDSVSNALEASTFCQKAVTLKYDSRNLVAFISPACADKEEARQSVAAILPYYAVPSLVVATDSFPTTNRGKIDKRKLLELAKIEKENSLRQNYKNLKLPEPKGFIQQIWKSPRLMEYNRLAMLIGIINTVFLVHGLTSGQWWSGNSIALSNISNMVISNFFIAIIVRQHYVINLLFEIATSFAGKWPLSIRRRMGKIYHFGGAHMGGTISATVWFAIFVVSLSHQFINKQAGVTTELIVVTYTLLALLTGMIILALPSLRARHHDLFERSHRFGGWTSFILFWAQTILFSRAQINSSGIETSLVSSFGFWMLVMLTISIALPWIRLRKVAIKIDRPSNHVAITHFNYGVTPFAGSSTAISRSPLKEWHSFANVPAPNKDGFRLTISKAGDWTASFINDMPSHVWVKAIPTAGVGNVDKLFKKVIWVATGSGIGPCLPHLLTRDVPSKLVWATRNPRKTYGDELVQEILDVQDDAIIWDTDVDGKPDMVKLAYLAYKDFNAEAVICISNKKLTWKVVTGMESRGIPAYGAIWDS